MGNPECGSFSGAGNWAALELYKRSPGTSPLTAVGNGTFATMKSVQDTSRKIPGSITEEPADAIAEYTVSQFEATALDKLWALWFAPGESGFAAVADTAGTADQEFHLLTLFDPGKAALSTLGLPAPGPEILSGVLQDMPIRIVDEPLGFVRRWIEIGGIIVSVVTANPIMGCACFKMLIHDEVHQILVASVKKLITNGGSSSRSISEHPHPHIDTSDNDEARPVRVPIENMSTPRSKLDTAASAEKTEQKAAADSPGRSRFTAPDGTAPEHKLPLGHVQRTRDHNGFKFVRLRVYYDPACAGAVANGLDHQPGLKRLIVVRESGRVKPWRTTAEHAKDKVCQIWNAADGMSFTRDPLTVAALQQNLPRMFRGQPLELDSSKITIEEISAHPADQYLDTAMHCIEIIGLLDTGISADPRPASLGFKTLARDDFFRSVIAAMDGLTS